MLGGMRASRGKPERSADDGGADHRELHFPVPRGRMRSGFSGPAKWPATDPRVPSSQAAITRRRLPSRVRISSGSRSRCSISSSSATTIVSSSRARTGTLELAAAARVRAYHQNGLAQAAIHQLGRPADWPSGDDHLVCVMTSHLRSDQTRSMTNKHVASNQQATKGWSTYNVIAVSFDDDRNAETAMTLLKELDAQERVVIEQAVVVVRRNDGQVVEADRTESTLMLGTASGGVIGLLIGIIGGPLGMLIGGAGGLYAGALFDIHDAGEAESALAGISSSVRVGRTALLAVVTEQSPDAIDTSMSGLGATVLRRSVADVDAEVAAAEKAQRKARLEARKELIRGRQQHDKAAVRAKIAELKDKLPRAQPERSMTPSDEMKDKAETAWAGYDAHLTKAEDHLEAAARKAEMEAAERDAQVRGRISQARDHVSGQR